MIKHQTSMIFTDLQNLAEFYQKCFLFASGKFTEAQ